MNITGNVVIGGIKPLDIETLLDLLTTAAKASVRDGSVSIGADLLMRMTRELIALKVGDAKVNPPQPQWQSPDNPGFAIKPMPGYAFAICETGGREASKITGMSTQLCGAS